jgi:pyruvate formate lyase activating enzyme
VQHGTVVQFERYAIHDGPGIRTVVYLKGCPLRCPWCHSPETQSPRPEVAIRSDRCIRCGTCLATCDHDAVVETIEGFDVDRDACQLCAECAAMCPTGAREIVGRTMTVGQVLAELERDVPCYDQSGGGVTISGGEPFMQPVFLEALAAKCRAHSLHTAIETCGLGDPDVFDRVAPYTDLFLYDLKLMDDERHRRITGGSNHVVFDNLARLVARGAKVRVRFPLIPGVNDDDENIVAMGAFVSSLGLSEVDILPYHRAGIAKYQRLGRPYDLPDVQPPSRGALVGVVGRLSRFGVSAHAGG